MGVSGCVCLPTSSHPGQVVATLQDYPCKRIMITPGWPHMPWFWDLVAMSSQIPICPIANTALQSDSSQESYKPKPTCVAPKASAIKEQGFYETVAGRIEAHQRGSTRSVYEAKWTIFTSGASVIRWTSGHHLPPSC